VFLCRAEVTVKGAAAAAPFRRTCAVLALAASLTAASAAGAGTTRLTRTEQSFVVAVNRIRSANALSPVAIDAKLVNAARFHSADMVEHGYFGHGAWDVRLVRFGAVGPRVGEDLGWAATADPVGTIVREWLASPSHRAVLLRPGFRRVGIGVRVGPFRGWPRAVVVTADFEGR